MVEFTSALFSQHPSIRSALLNLAIGCVVSGKVVFERIDFVVGSWCRAAFRLGSRARAESRRSDTQRPVPGSPLQGPGL